LGEISPTDGEAVDTILAEINELQDLHDAPECTEKQLKVCISKGCHLIDRIKYKMWWLARGGLAERVSITTLKPSVRLQAQA
jgi:hypothetical protein